jgi:hypothetical protein
VPSEDLTSIPGLEENHRRALADKLGITSVRALAGADQRAIYDALRHVGHRPTLARVADWQDVARRRITRARKTRQAARSRMRQAANDRSEWHTAASFAVIFARRQVDGDWEHRLEAEQTEVEPEPAHQEWSGWDCQPLCEWMRGQVSLPEDRAEPDAGVASAERAALRIDSATITDANHELDLIAAGELIGTPPEDLTPPIHLSFTVSGGRSGQQVQAAVWFRPPPEPGWSRLEAEPMSGWSPHEPVTVPPSGQAEFDLPSAPPSEYQVRLLAWTTDAHATMAGVTLPKLAFRQPD